MALNNPTGVVLSGGALMETRKQRSVGSVNKRFAASWDWRRSHANEVSLIALLRAASSRGYRECSP